MECRSYYPFICTHPAEGYFDAKSAALRDGGSVAFSHNLKSELAKAPSRATKQSRVKLDFSLDLSLDLYLEIGCLLFMK